MSTPRILHARAYLDDGKWWTIEIPELTTPAPNGATGVAIGGTTKFREIDAAARDLAAVWLDVDESEVDVRVTIETPDEVRKLWTDGNEADTEAREAVKRAASLKRQALAALRAQGWTLEASAAGLGISKQRAQQLDKESTRETVSAR